MGIFDDYFNSSGQVRGKFSNMVSTSSNTVTNSGNGGWLAGDGNSRALLDPRTDEQWGGIYTGQTTNNYYDYYFSGQDVQAFIDGTESDPEYGNLPLVGVTWDMNQKKQVLYGFWSYTYDCVVRGTRLVAGEFELAFRSPNYLKQAIALAAKTRQENSSANYTYFRGLTEDDANIQKYWGNNMDPSLMSGQNTNLFSEHPPFSFVIIYGIQNVSLSDGTGIPVAEDYSMWQGDNPMMTDLNERLIQGPNQSMRIVLDGCEITGMKSRVNNSGEVLTETYAFFARDIVIPDPSASGGRGPALS